MIVKTLPLDQALSRLNLPDLNRTLFSSPRWLDVIVKTYGTHFEVKYIEEGGEVVSYLIYSVVRNFLEWKICMASYCDYCDAYGMTSERWRVMFQALRDDYPEYRIALRNLRDRSARESGVFQELSREWFHQLDTTPSITELWKKAHASYKAAVNQAVRKGVTSRICGKEDLPKFYDAHLHVRKDKYRIFPQPYLFFENIWDTYMTEQKGFLLGAFDPDGEFIGANIYLVCGDTLYYKFNTSRMEGLRFRPNNFLFWEGVKLAKELGLNAIDLGSSGLNQSGLIRFKEHAGAHRQPIVHLGYHPPGYKFSQKRILRWYTGIMTRNWMPDTAVRWGSRVIYPYLA
ncbi:MAG: GNAT family N-acetyltransferase [Candidatus Omnitrophota bacterium]